MNKEYINNYINVNIGTNNDYDDLVNPNEGFKRGNIFDNLYWPYNKDTYNFIPNNKRQELLIEIMKNNFYAHELNLLLDIHNDDKNIINLFNKYNKKGDELIQKYNEEYEPLTLNNNNLNEVPWIWEDSPWPWEGV